VDGSRLELTVGPQTGTPPVDTPPPQSPEPVKGCGADILTILRECGVRMTGPQLMAEMDERRMEHSERSVTRWLGLLRQAGLVDHDPLAHPSGYGATGGTKS
jgi:hypothetical protein